MRIPISPEQLSHTKFAKYGAIALFIFFVVMFILHFVKYPQVDAAAVEEGLRMIKEQQRVEACIRATKNYYRCVKSRDPNSQACLNFGESDQWYFATYGEDMLPSCIPFQGRVGE